MPADRVDRTPAGILATTKTMIVEAVKLQVSRRAVANAQWSLHRPAYPEVYCLKSIGELNDQCRVVSAASQSAYKCPKLRLLVYKIGPILEQCRPLAQV